MHIPPLTLPAALPGLAGKDNTHLVLIVVLKPLCKATPTLYSLSLSAKEKAQSSNSSVCTLIILLIFIRLYLSVFSERVIR